MRARGRRTGARALPGARRRALAAVERLAREYPEAVTALTHVDPWQLLVATILSAQTTDARVNQVTPVLFARWPSPAALGGANLDEVEAVIRATGFFRAKARAIVAMSQDIAGRFGGQVPERLDDLLSLRGVGRKTANVVLGSAFASPGFAVDTHVRRLTNRLGLTRSLDPVRIEQDVTALVPREEWSALSLRLILHGRRVCAARRPRCDRCVLADDCPSADVGAGSGSPSGSDRWRQGGQKRGRRAHSDAAPKRTRAAG